MDASTTRFSRFVLDDQGDDQTLEVDVPANQSLRDFVRRMGDVLFNLERIERRSREEILEDILRSRSDAVRLRWEGKTVSSGRVGVELGAHVIHLTRDLLLAAACAALERKRVFTKRKRNEAMEFLNRAQLAPPKAGSFIVTVEVPLPPHLQQTLDSAVADDSPFERRVMVLLSEAVAAAHAAASAASGSGDISPIVNAVSHGVSANLCDSIAGMIRTPDFDALEFSFSWSPTRKLSKAPSAQLVRFTPDQGEILGEAAKILRAAEREPDFVLCGPVVSLSSTAPTGAGGEAKIAGIVDGVVRRISVTLTSADYVAAVEAHKQERDVTVEGELIQVGHRFELENARSFGVRTDDRS